MNSDLGFQENELREYITLVWRWLWLIVLGAILAGLTAFIVSQRMTPVYEASATILVNQARNPATANYQDIITSERVARTYAEMMKRRPILEQAVVQVGLDPETLDPDAVKITPLRDTQLIEVTVEHPSPQIAAALANTLPQVFIAENEKMQTARFASSKANLAAQLDTLSRDIKQTQQAIQELGDPQTPAQEAELARLQTLLTQYQNSYTSLLQSFENLRLAEAQSLDTITVVEPAAIPQHPIRPRVRLNTLLAAIVGAMLATGVVFLIEYLDDTIRSPDELERLVGLPSLGTIARMPEEVAERHLITFEEPRHPISEAYRTLRTNLQFSAVDTGLQSLLVTSANPMEGKTTTAVNLAVVMAQTGRSVILVDADLRRPRTHEFFGFSNNQGLSDSILKHHSAPRLALRETDIPNLRVLSSGPLPPNPAELLGSQRMQELIDELRQEADVLIFDTPPVLAVTDAAVLARKIDGVLLVVDASHTRRDAVIRAVEALRKVNANILGVAMNRLTHRSRGYYYDYQYYYYGEGEKKKRRSKTSLAGYPNGRPTPAEEVVPSSGRRVK